jgi:hypothetical protein
MSVEGRNGVDTKFYRLTTLRLPALSGSGGQNRGPRKRLRREWLSSARSLSLKRTKTALHSREVAPCLGLFYRVIRNNRDFFATFNVHFLTKVRAKMQPLPIRLKGIRLRTLRFTKTQVTLDKNMVLK